jgi:protein SCO1/2
MRVFPVLLLVLAVAGCARGNAAADFTLQDAGGAPWSLAAQRGKAVVLTFGYTHCTDTCPATLAKLAQATRALGTRAADVEVAFVTVDPQRDTPAILRAYLQKFDPRFVGLTGTPQQVAAVEQAYHVWAQRIPGKRGNDNYDDAHSSAIFFIDARGNTTALHDGNDSVDVLTRAASDANG